MRSDEENESGSEYENDSERNKIRSELSLLSFEELQKLKERMGSKVYNEALFGIQKNPNSNQHKVFKRENKNRPREISAKKPVSMIRDIEMTKKKSVIRDPRFDPLCGEFDKKQFNDNYKFLDKYRETDLKAVRKEMKETDDPEKKQQCRRLIQRLKDQIRSNKHDEAQNKLIQKHKQNIEQTLRQGQQPHFATKSERRVESLVEQYEALKSEGTSRIQRHLKRRQQKVKKKSYQPPTGSR